MINRRAWEKKIKCLIKDNLHNYRDVGAQLSESERQEFAKEETDIPLYTGVRTINSRFTSKGVTEETEVQVVAVLCKKPDWKVLNQLAKFVPSKLGPAYVFITKEQFRRFTYSAKHNVCKRHKGTTENTGSVRVINFPHALLSMNYDAGGTYPTPAPDGASKLSLEEYFLRNGVLSIEEPREDYKDGVTRLLCYNENIRKVRALAEELVRRFETSKDIMIIEHQRQFGSPMLKSPFYNPNDAMDEVLQAATSEYTAEVTTARQFHQRRQRMNMQNKKCNFDFGEDFPDTLNKINDATKPPPSSYAAAAAAKTAASTREEQTIGSGSQSISEFTAQTLRTEITAIVKDQLKDQLSQYSAQLTRQNTRMDNMDNKIVQLLENQAIETKAREEERDRKQEEFLTRMSEMWKNQAHGQLVLNSGEGTLSTLTPTKESSKNSSEATPMQVDEQSRSSQKRRLEESRQVTPAGQLHP